MDRRSLGWFRLAGQADWDNLAGAVQTRRTINPGLSWESGDDTWTGLKNGSLSPVCTRR